MNTYKVKANYTQWIEIEIQAENEDEAYELANDIDLDEWREYDINDFYIHDTIYLGKTKEAV